MVLQNHSPAENRLDPPGLLLHGLDPPVQEVPQRKGRAKAVKRVP